MSEVVLGDKLGRSDALANLPLEVGGEETEGHIDVESKICHDFKVTDPSPDCLPLVVAAILLIIRLLEKQDEWHGEHVLDGENDDEHVPVVFPAGVLSDDVRSVPDCIIVLLLFLFNLLLHFHRVFISDGFIDLRSHAAGQSLHLGLNSNVGRVVLVVVFVGCAFGHGVCMLDHFSQVAKRHDFVVFSLLQLHVLVLRVGAVIELVELLRVVILGNHFVHAIAASSLGLFFRAEVRLAFLKLLDVLNVPIVGESMIL